MKKALVFGGSGQAGRYLCDHLINKGYDVVGTFHVKKPEASAELAQPMWTFCDVVSSEHVLNLLRFYEPDEIYNLASKMYAPRSWEFPYLYTETNYLPVVTILDWIYRHNPKIKYFQAGSAEVFDLRQSPQSETTPLRPRNPYGVAKAAAQELVRCYREQKGLFACTGILFNMESPLRSTDFFSRKVVTEVVRIKRALDKGETPEPLKLGKLHAIRDWGYTKEYMEAAHLMLQAKEPDDYVIATGFSNDCEGFVEEAFECVDIRWPQAVKYLEYEKSDSINDYRDAIVGDPSKICRKLGWQAHTQVYDLIKLMVEAEMSKEPVTI